jgi:hypothetical protein
MHTDSAPMPSDEAQVEPELAFERNLKACDPNINIERPRYEEPNRSTAFYSLPSHLSGRSADMKKTLLSVLVGIGALATGAFAQAPGSIDQYGREFRAPSQEYDRDSARESRTNRAAQGQRRPSQRDLDARAQRLGSNFDGAWSVAIITRNGACEPQYRFGVRIINGNVVYEGETTGRVAPNGSVQVSIAQGDQRANGQGRLSRDQGSGVWRGVGSAGNCAGTWVAERRD